MQMNIVAIFQPYRNLEAGDNQSLKSLWQDRKSNPGPLAPQIKSLTTTVGHQIIGRSPLSNAALFRALKRLFAKFVYSVVRCIKH